MMGSHSFDIDIAVEYGIESAILLQNINYWIEKNIANEKHFYDGLYWTYNSVKAFNELFPYISESTIRRTLKTLEDNGIIKMGNYNKAGYDRTMWYAITEKGFSILNKSILSNRQMDLFKVANGFSQSDKPIPDIKQDINTNDKHKEESSEIPIISSKPKKEKKSFTPPTQEEVINYVLEKQLVINPYTFFDYYSKLDWYDNQGQKVQSWKGKAVTWDIRDKKSNPGINPYSLPSETIPVSEFNVSCCGHNISRYRPFCITCGKEFNMDGTPK